MKHRLLFSLFLCSALFAQDKPEATEVWGPVPPVVETPAGKAPSYALVLFDGGDLSEWRSPLPATGEGQNRGNSGVYLQGKYELQVLDSHRNPTYVNGQAASLYKRQAPLVNASRPPGVWQSYDILFRAPVSAGEPDNGRSRQPGRARA